MASRLLSRVSRRIIAGGRPIGASPAWNDPIRRLAPAGGCRSLEIDGAPFQTLKSLQQPFAVNSTLQRFGFSSAASPTAEANKLPTEQSLGMNKGNYSKASSSLSGLKKIMPYTLLFGWIEEIILDYVHHEVTRKMVLLYLRLFLIILMKDVFISCYDILAPPAA